MSYTPTEWIKGDKITADRLNKMESGIASTIPFVDATGIEPFNGRVYIEANIEAPACYPVSPDAMADNSIVLIEGEDLGFFGGKFMLSSFRIIETELRPEEVGQSDYLLPTGTKVKVDALTGAFALYDSSVTPIHGEMIA